MKRIELDHIGIAVEDLDKAMERFVGQLGLAGDDHRETVEEQGVEVAFAKVDNGCTMEFLRPTRADSPIARFLEKKGEGIHHVALQVDNLEERLARLKAEGVALIDQVPRKGAHGKKIAFVHPKGTMGVLVELCEDSGEQE